MSAAVLTRPGAAPSARPAPPRAALLDRLEQVDAFPTLSDTAVRAMALAARPAASTLELADLIRRDGVAAAAVLRRANSARYGGRGEVADVGRAVVRVGLAECGRILCALGVRAVSAAVPAAARVRCDAVHRHSLFVAHLAAALGRSAGRGDGGAEFTAGLLHDIGRVVIAARCPDAAAAADPPDLRRSGPAPLAREREVLGIDHCAVGHQFAVRNGLPDAMGRVILNHHRPEEERGHRPLVGLVAAANELANHVQREHNLSGYSPDACPGFEVFEWDVPVDRRGAVRAALAGLVVGALRETRAMLKAGL